MVSVIYDCETKANLIEVTNTVKVLLLIANDPCCYICTAFCVRVSKIKLSRPKLDN